MMKAFKLYPTSRGAAHLWRVWILLALAAAALWLPRQAAAQTGDPFTCDAVFYQIRSNNSNTQMLQFVTVGGTPTAVYTALLGESLNGLGYNPSDNYMYAIRTGARQPELYRLGLNGYAQAATLVTPVGTPANVALTAGFVITAATFDAVGNYYFAGQSTNIVPPAIYRIKPLSSWSGTSNQTVEMVYQLRTTAGAAATFVNVGDLSFGGTSVGPNGNLYGATGTTLAQVTLTAAISGTLGTATFRTLTMATAVGGIGSAFFDTATSRLYVYDNNTQNYWEIQGYDGAAPNAVSTPSVPFIGSPAIAGINATDGTSCVLTGQPPLADLSTTKTVTPGTTTAVGQAFTFNVGVQNAGPFPAYQVTLLDQLGAGYTFVSSTQTAGTTYTAATGVWNVGALGIGASAALTVIATSNATGTTTLDYMNRVQITQSRRGPFSGITLLDPDSTVNNKTGTWVVPTEDDEAVVTVVRTVNLSITKTNGLTSLASGSTTGYSVTVANTGVFDAGGSVVADPAVTGLSCTTPPTCVVTVGTATCPATGTGPGELSIGNWQGAGVVIPSLKSGATLVFRSVCTVTASGP